MTVSATVPVSGPHIADGINRLWQFDFKLFNVAHVQLVITDADGSNEQTISSGFSVAAQYLNNSAGGYIQYPIDPVAPLLSGKRVFAVRAVPYEQAQRIGNQGGFFPEIHERVMDLLEMQIQQINERQNRSITFGYSGDVLADGMEPPPYVAGALWAYDATEQKIVTRILSDIPVAPLPGGDGYIKKIGAALSATGAAAAATLDALSLSFITLADPADPVEFAAACSSGKIVLVPSSGSSVTLTTFAQLNAVKDNWNNIRVLGSAFTVVPPTGRHVFTTPWKLGGMNERKLSLIGVNNTNVVFSSLGAIVDTGVGNHSVTINHTSAAAVAVGDMVRAITLVGTNTEPLHGVWEATAKVGNAVTYKITSRKAALDTPTISSGLFLRQNTVFQFNSCIGFLVEGDNGDGSAVQSRVENICVLGNNTGLNSGIFLEYGSKATFGPNVTVANFGSFGVYGLYGSVFNGQSVVASGNTSSGFYGVNGADIQAVEAISTGNGDSGFAGAYGASISATGSISAGNQDGHYNILATMSAVNGKVAGNAAAGIKVERGGVTDFTGGTAKLNVTGLHAKLGGRIIGTGATITTNTADRLRETGGEIIDGGADTDATTYATAAEYRSMTTGKALTTDAVSGGMAEVALTDAATILWDAKAGIDFTVTIAGNRTLGNPSNIDATVIGRRGRIRVVQDATGGRTLTKSSNHKTAGGVPLVIASAANAETFIDYDIVSATKVRLSNSQWAWF